MIPGDKIEQQECQLIWLVSVAFQSLERHLYNDADLCSRQNLMVPVMRACRVQGSEVSQDKDFWLELFYILMTLKNPC